MHFIKIFNLHMKPSFPELSREFVVAAVCISFFFLFQLACQKGVRKKGMQINICISSDEEIKLQ